MKNIEKIQQMTIDDWYDQVTSDFHVVPVLCFMCVGCEKCNEFCSVGVAEWLEQEAEEG